MYLGIGNNIFALHYRNGLVSMVNYLMEYLLSNKRRRLPQRNYNKTRFIFRVTFENLVQMKKY